jgi:hypothetical protein
VTAADRVPLPQNVEQAIGMVLVATMWLKEHAPTHLRDHSADLARMTDALESIAEHVAPQPSALATAILATCHNGLGRAPVVTVIVPPVATTCDVSRSAAIERAAAHVLQEFEKTEAAGYSTRDRQFAISTLSKALRE